MMQRFTKGGDDDRKDDKKKEAQPVNAPGDYNLGDKGVRAGQGDTVPNEALL